MANCSLVPPFSWQVVQLAGRDVTIGALLTAASLCFVATIALYVEECVFLARRCASPHRRNKLLIVMGLFPIFSMTSLVTLWVPRASLYSNFLSSGYLAVTMLVFFTLLADYHGGKVQLLHELSDTNIKFNTPPCCCCCLCLPKTKLTRKIHGILRALVLQYTVVRPLLEYIGAVAGADGTLDDAQISAGSAYLWLTILRLVSTMVCMYGCIVIYQNVKDKEKFQHLLIRPKFVLVQLVLFLTNIQTAILSVLSTAGAVPCNPDTLFNVRSRANALNHLLIVFEMLLLAVAARCFYPRGDPLLQKDGGKTPYPVEGRTNPAGMEEDKQNDEDKNPTDVEGITNPDMEEDGSVNVVMDDIKTDINDKSITV